MKTKKFSRLVKIMSGKIERERRKEETTWTINVALLAIGQWKKSITHLETQTTKSIVSAQSALSS